MSLYLMTWQKLRTILLAVLILLFMVGVVVLMNMGKHIDRAAFVSTPQSEDFGQFLVDHYALLSPFFEKNQQDMVKHGEVLLFEVMGDIMLLSILMNWVISGAAAFGYSSMYLPRYGKIPEAMLYATWRVGLDIAVFIMATFGAFGWELAGSPFPGWLLLMFFLTIEIIAQSIVFSNVYHTNPMTSSFFSLLLLMGLLGIGIVVFGPIVKKRMSVMMAEFVDVPSLTVAFQKATAEAKRQLSVYTADRDKAAETASAAQAKLDEIRKAEKTLSDDYEAKRNSEPYVYGRIIRIRASGNLPEAKDEITAFLAKFPNGTLVTTAKAQLELIEQEMGNRDAQKQSAMMTAEQARLDLIARAAKGQVTLVEMRHGLLGKTPKEVEDMFGKPAVTAAGRWGYSNKMLLNPATNEQLGLTVNFVEGLVVSVEYFYGG